MLLLLLLLLLCKRVIITIPVVRTESLFGPNAKKRYSPKIMGGSKTKKNTSGFCWNKNMEIHTHTHTHTQVLERWLFLFQGLFFSYKLEEGKIVGREARDGTNGHTKDHGTGTLG